jgi:hypothetical protein
MYTVLQQPLSKKAIRDFSDAKPGNYIRGIVAMDLSDLIDNDFEGILHLMSEKLTGTGLLTDIHFKIVGFEDDTKLHIEISGDLSQIDLGNES